MTNVEKLKELSMLYDVRCRLGAEDPEDTIHDSKINVMDNKEIVATWAAWDLGDEEWGRDIIEAYESLRSYD